VWYSYAIVRVVPRVERGECVNVGVVLVAREQDFLGARLELDADRLLSLAPTVDLGAVNRHLAAFLAICDGRPEGGPLAVLPQPERFHWLVAPRSTMVQTSPVHIGRSLEPDKAVEDLLDEFVRLPTYQPSEANEFKQPE
jgi:hypothetical protein